MISIIGVVCLILATGLTASGQRLMVTVTNPAAVPCARATVSIPLEKVTEAVGSATGLQFVVRAEKEGAVLVHQITEEELLFQCDLGSGEVKRFVIQAAPRRTVPSPSVVSGLFALPREDYAWENDRIAFRMYGPALAAEVNNGIDVWTKRVSYPIVAKWYKESEGSLPGKDSYHTDKGEGADYFSVGRTLGAGGSGLWIDGKVAQPGVFVSQKTMATGPLRVAFQLTYHWVFGKDTLREIRTVTLDAGHYLNRIDVSFPGWTTAQRHKFVCGLVKRPGVVAERGDRECWLALWGPVTADTLTGSLGTGLVIPRQVCGEFAEDKDQFLITGEPSADGSYTYYAGAAWSEQRDIRNGREWAGYLRAFSTTVQSPVQVVLSR